MDKSFFLTRLSELTKEVYTKSMLSHAKIYEPYDLTPMQVAMLSALKNNGRLKVSELGVLLRTPDSNVSVICSKLEKRNLITRVRDEKDRRIVYIEATPEANIICAKFKNKHLDLEKAIEHVSDKDKVEIIKALEKLVKIVDEATKNLENEVVHNEEC